MNPEPPAENVSASPPDSTANAPRQPSRECDDPTPAGHGQSEGRVLHLSFDPHSRRLRIQLCDETGQLLRTIPASASLSDEDDRTYRLR